jgi:hypothetical protein
MRALKGAFLDVGAGLSGTLPNIVVFQFNPDTVTRTPSIAQRAQASSGEGRKDALAQADEAQESISFTLRIDASDQLTGRDPSLAVERGILPTLSALELLMTRRKPKSAGGGSAALNPPARIPSILFFWGRWRIIPVTITSMTITESQFDVRLNPVHAEVSVSLQVLTPAQMASDDKWGLKAYQYMTDVKMQMATLNAANALDIGVSSSHSITV